MSSPDESEVVSPPAKRLRRSYVACHRCHAQKIKCSGETPCRSCCRSNCAYACVFPVRERKVTVLDSYLKKLQQENEELKRKQADVAAAVATSPILATPIVPNLMAAARRDSLRDTGASSGASSSATLVDQDAEEDVANADVANPLLEQRVTESDAAQSSSLSSKPVYIGGSACAAFATRLRAHVSGGAAPSPIDPSLDPSSSSELAGEPCLIPVFKHPRLLRALDAPFELPSRAYGMMLVQVVLRFVGNDYHFVRKKDFVRRLNAVYDAYSGLEGTKASPAGTDPVFLCRVFAVFALGELYLKKTAMTEGGMRVVPGTNFFLQATGLFQELYEEPDVEYIETLLLLSFYSYALNRKNSAYTYSGLALRLSITLGLHRNITYSPTISPADIENRRRVWWTVYTFDRLCSSKLGHPIMIKDEDIDAPLPSSNELSAEERDDFVEAEQLIANIKLSRITGNILDLIYAIPAHREHGFVRNVHRILTALKDWDATLPVGLKLNHEKMPPYSSRSVASLRLHFNQCIILTTRPILLYVFKHHVKRTHPTSSTSPSTSIPSPGTTGSHSAFSTKPLSPMTIALSEACIYAARASNRLLGQLWADGSIATFGYWDAHYLFSSMIVLLMSHTLNPNPGDADAVALAWNLIQSMVDDGNLPAREFYERLVSLQGDLDELARADGPLRARRPEKGFVTGGEFAAPVVPGWYAGAPRVGGVQGGAMVGAGAGEMGMKVLSPSGMGGGVTPGGSNSGALDDPFIRDFLGQPDSEWSPGMLDMSNEELGTWSLAWDTGHLFQGMGECRE